jgi:ABC-type proline/glycine betaine transport system substrate-binding protein
MTRPRLKQFLPAAVATLTLLFTAFTITLAAQSREVRIADLEWDAAVYDSADETRRP